MWFIIIFFRYVKNCHSCDFFLAACVRLGEASLILMTPTTMKERSFPTAHPVIPGLDYFGDWRPATGASFVDPNTRTTPVRMVTRNPGLREGFSIIPPY